MRYGHSLVLAVSLCLALASACGSEGQTPVCSTFPAPYDVRTERGRLGARKDIAAAAADGCLTLPAGFDDDAEGGAGGAGGASGAGGSPEPSAGAPGAGAPADAGSAGATAEAGAAGASQ